MYKPLVHSKRTIRLLTLLPGSGEICCRLTECPLEDAKGRYKAISYTWKGGTETVPQCIYCEDFGEIEVMPNLYAVLRRLRDAKHIVILWIDWLCIDQNNTEERTHQVGMMRDIYANSTEVIIWLGSGGETDVINRPIIEFWGDDRDIQHITSHLERMYSQKQYARPLTHRTDMYGTFCIISLLAQGLNASKIWYLRRLEYAPAIIQGLSSLLEMSWVCPTSMNVCVPQCRDSWLTEICNVQLVDQDMGSPRNCGGFTGCRLLRQHLNSMGCVL